MTEATSTSKHPSPSDDAPAGKAKLAVWKFTSCDGCQLSLLDCEDELLTLAGQVDIAYFMEASSRQLPGPYDLSIVEGSITTPEQRELIQAVRAQSRFLIAIGACATAGGIQALRNMAQVDDYIQIVYANPEYIDTLDRSTPLSDHVNIDFELRGCPINKHQLVEVISAFLNRRRPRISEHAVCVECKLNNTVCVAVSRGEACMGPVTQAGCGALCPRYHRPCYGCYGPKENANPQALIDWQSSLGIETVKILENFTNFNTAAPPFHNAASSIRRDRQNPPGKSP
ncbi:oxidoreductase [Aestuariicella hydrocarbonica]|uniref:Oxidoreductase n=1 Tax=Pseudomaricurvus hydrocarbonicus TaxID=1470433 RepID=A0A9E5MN57_9GAMM|nr:oxidoreductase [Aestuariicella hydrocarbonica]NHO67300.1 oxidoreductase [Aestuariicella hydrocarbonica]